MANKSVRELKQLGKDRGYGPKQHKIKMKPDQGQKETVAIIDSLHKVTDEIDKVEAAELKRIRKQTKNLAACKLRS